MEPYHSLLSKRNDQNFKYSTITKFHSYLLFSLKIKKALRSSDEKCFTGFVYVSILNLKKKNIQCRLTIYLTKHILHWGQNTHVPFKRCWNLVPRILSTFQDCVQSGTVVRPLVKGNEDNEYVIALCSEIIRHFRVHFSLYFKARLSAKSLLWRSVFIHIEIRTNCHNKNLAPRLALKERLIRIDGRSKTLSCSKWTFFRTNISNFYEYIICNIQLYIVEYYF